MNEVQTTQTFADRNAEKKRHADEMAVLNSQKEILTRETKETIEAADTARETLATLTACIKENTDTVTTASRETTYFIEFCVTQMLEARKKFTEMLEMAHVIELESKKSGDSLRLAQEKLKTVHETIVQETQALQQNKDDLDVYHTRLKAYFKEYLPDQSIIL